MQARRHAQGRLPLFDAVATYSSVEHSGLGRCICCVLVIQGRAGARACVRACVLLAWTSLVRMEVEGWSAWAHECVHA